MEMQMNTFLCFKSLLASFCVRGLYSSEGLLLTSYLYHFEYIVCFGERGVCIFDIAIRYHLFDKMAFAL